MKIKCIPHQNPPTFLLAKCSMNLKNLFAQGDVDPNATSEIKNMFKQIYSK